MSLESGGHSVLILDLKTFLLPNTIMQKQSVVLLCVCLFTLSDVIVSACCGRSQWIQMPQLVCMQRRWEIP